MFIAHPRPYSENWHKLFENKGKTLTKALMSAGSAATLHRSIRNVLRWGQWWAMDGPSLPPCRPPPRAHLYAQLFSSVSMYLTCEK